MINVCERLAAELERGSISSMQRCLVTSASCQQSSGARVGPTHRLSSAMRVKALNAGGSLSARLQVAVALDVVQG